MGCFLTLRCAQIVSFRGFQAVFGIPSGPFWTWSFGAGCLDIHSTSNTPQPMLGSEPGLRYHGTALVESRHCFGIRNGIRMNLSDDRAPLLIMKFCRQKIAPRRTYAVIYLHESSPKYQRGKSSSFGGSASEEQAQYAPPATPPTRTQVRTCRPTTARLAILQPYLDHQIIANFV